MTVKRPNVRFIIMALLCTMGGGCQALNSTGGIEVCTVWRPVTWSQRDTPETVDGVKGNNARRTAYCGG